MLTLQIFFRDILESPCRHCHCIYRWNNNHCPARRWDRGIKNLYLLFGCPLFTPYTDADILTILATNVNLVSKHYSQIHVIFLEEIDHISENSIRNVLWGEKICFLRLKHKYWQRDTKGMHSEGPRGMVPSHLLALRLPSIHISSTTCLDYTCSYC